MSGQFWVDSRVQEALYRCFDQLDKYQRDGHCTPEDIRRWLVQGWGEDMLDAWNEWRAEDEEF